MQIFVCRRKPLLPVTSIEATKPKQCLSATAGTTKMLQQAARIMKITAVILLGACLQLHAAGFGQKVTLSEKDTPIERVFEKIQEQTNYKFLYSDQLLQHNPKVTITVKNATVEEVLDHCLKGKMLEYEINDYTIIIRAQKDLVTKNIQPNPTLAGPIEVRGIITDENGAPAQGVNVMVKGSSKGTTTNLRGEFSLKDVDENAVLLITSVGYDRQEILVKNKPFVSLQLKVAVGSLDEMQVIAYGKVSKRLNTGNVVTVKSADIEKQPVTNPLLALQGRVAGMEITQATGLPGTGVTVRIRGINSLKKGNDPLYVVDGVPYLSQMLPGAYASVTGTSGAVGESAGAMTGNPLNYINPGDIESIDVLKDADATAIYGTRGANGVVLITTKKGKAGPLRVDINVQQGWGKVTRFTPWLNTRQYLDMRYEALKNDGIDLSSLTPTAENYDLTIWDTTRYTDWNKELIGGTAKFFNAQVSLYGGSSNVQYRIGYNYNKQTTVFPKSFGDPKGTLSFSVNSSSSNNRLQVQLSGNYQADKNELPDFDLSGYTNLPPNAPALYNGDGSLNWERNPLTGSRTWQNPLSYLNAKYKRRVNNLISNAILSYQLFDGFEVKVNTGYTNMQSREVRTNPASAYDPIRILLIDRWSKFANTQHDNWIVEPQLNYSMHIGGSNFTALIGATIQQNNSKSESIMARGFNSDLVIEDSKAATSVTTESNIEAEYKYSAVFGRFNYNFRDKYLLNLTARRDGTSRFGSDKQFANFWAAGLGWIFSKETFFMKKLSLLSFGKLRASYGTTGSDQVGDYQFLNLYRYVSYAAPYQNTPSLILNGLFNPELAWEENKKFELGVELGFFQDRLYVNASYYRNRSSNQLYSYNLPLNTGSPSVPANLDATIQNKGWEFVVNATIMKSKNFRWSSSLNLTIPRNKLVSLSPGAYLFDRRLIGRSLSTSFVYRYIGVDPATGIYLFSDEKGGTTFMPDTAYDLNTNSLTTEHPLNTSIKFFGGFQNSFSFKSFQLDILFQFSKKPGVTNERGRYPGSFSTFNQPVTVLNRWQKPGDDAYVQRFNQDFSIYNSVDFLNSSDAVWRDASFIQLENISLSWQMPSAWKQKMHIQNARIFTQAQNVFTIYPYKGVNPETFNLNSLPPLRMWTVGIQLSLQ